MNWNTPFPEAFDGHQGSPNNSVDRLAFLSNRLSPVESRLSNNRIGIHDGSISCTSTPSNRARDNRGWDIGESSSSGNSMREQILDDDSDMKLAWYSSCGASSVSVRSVDWSAGPSTSGSSSYVGNQVSNMPENFQNYSSTPLSLRPNHRHLRDSNCHSGLGAGRPHTLHEPGRAGTEEILVCRASSSNLGTSLCNSNISIENNDASEPLLGSWGSSCKRKAVEGSSGHLCSGGSSHSNQPMENTVQHPVPGRCTTSRNLSISPNVSSAGHLEQLNSRSGVGTSRVRSGRFTSSIVQGITENPVRNHASRSMTGHSESVPFDTSRGPSLGLSSLYASQPQSLPISNSNSLELMSPMTLSPNLNDALNEPFPNVDEAGRAHVNHWNGSFSSRRGSSSSSFQLSGERSFGAHEEVNFRRSLRNIPEYPTSSPAPDTRDIYGDQIDWSFTPDTSLFSRNYSASSISLGSGGRSSSPAWLPNRNQASQDQRRFSEAVNWIPFPRIESDSRSQRSPFSHSHLASSSSDEVATSSNAQHQSGRRPAAFSRDVRRDDTNSRNVIAAVESRHRLIRQVLTAMQRSAHLRDEDYMLSDPYADDLLEFHEQHIDMMLDVDNMSYEELLALEEQIGNVSTGLSEEKISESMKNRKCGAVRASQEMEPCCICREDYAGGDDIGILDCGHEFHTGCIKQWLILKNLCPICKGTALET